MTGDAAAFVDVLAIMSVGAMGVLQRLRVSEGRVRETCGKEAGQKNLQRVL
jgi:hypothetical protein